MNVVLYHTDVSPVSEKRSSTKKRMAGPFANTGGSRNTVPAFARAMSQVAEPVTSGDDEEDDEARGLTTRAAAKIVDERSRVKVKTYDFYSDPKNMVNTFQKGRRE
jgi:hypothetical protein